MMVKTPISPPIAEPAKRSTPFCVLAPMVESEHTMHVITEV